MTTSPDDVINADYVARSPLADVAVIWRKHVFVYPGSMKIMPILPCVPIKESYSLPCTYGGLGSRLCQVRGGL